MNDETPRNAIARGLEAYDAIKAENAALSAEREALRTRLSMLENEHKALEAVLRTAEVNRDIHFRISVSAITQLEAFRKQLDGLLLQVQDAITDAKAAPYRASGLRHEPPDTAPLTEEEEARVKRLAEALAPEPPTTTFASENRHD